MRTARVITLAASVCIAGCVGCNRGVQNSPAPKKQAASAAVTQATDSASAPAVTNEQPTLVAKTKKVDAGELMDPRNDGWDSEAFAEAAKKQLSKIFAHADHLTNPSEHGGDTEDHANGQAIEAPNVAHGSGWQPKLRARQAEVPPSIEEAWAGLLDPEAQVISPIESLQEVFNDGHVRVFRPDESATKSLSLAETVEQLASSLSSRGTVRRAWKVIGVNVEAARPETKCLYEGFAVSDAGRVQQTAQLTCVWQATDGKLKLTDLRIQDFEEVSLSGGAWFTDETARVLSQDPCYELQLQRGGNHWLQRIERAHGMDDSARNGLALGDANGDGLDDVYLCQPPGLPNRLFLQQSDGTFADHAAESGVDFLDQTSSALFVDFDNDGDQDLAVGSTGAVLIMSNDGSGVFSTAATLTPQLTDVQSLAAADFDLDGDVDLFVCVYRDESGKQRGEFVFHNAVDGGRNFLFRNDITRDAEKDGVWQFRDVTVAMGLAADASRYTLAAAWEDYDNDGDPDLYLANDYGRNILYRNDRNRFEDVTASTRLNDTGFGMSADWGDFNRDGAPDLYVGNMFSSAGSRITNQPGFQKQATAEQRMVYRRMAQGNSLFSGGDEETFHDVSSVARVQMGRWAWSSCFADLNNDGWEDLVVANGYITAESTGDL